MQDPNQQPILPRFFQPLRVKIWLTVVFALLVLMVLLYSGWKFHQLHELADNPLQRAPSLLLFDDDGLPAGVVNIIKTRQNNDAGARFEILAQGDIWHFQLPNQKEMNLGDVSWWSTSNWGWGTLLAMIFLGLALAIAPVAHRLTKRLMILQGDVKKWGNGELSYRSTLTGQDEAGQLAEHFNVAATQIEKLVKAQQLLLANASHELRSPLARINMAVALLEPSWPAPSAFQLEMQNEIHKSMGELNDLIGEILLSCRLQQQITPNLHLYEWQTVDFHDLVRNQVERTNTTLQCLLDDGTSPSGVVVVSSDYVNWKIHAMPVLLRRLLHNLFENAHRHGKINHAKNAYPPHVTLTKTTQPPQIILTITDAGNGIPFAERLRVFEPFYRTKGASETDGGVGLGLSLVQSITQSHGGTVVCHQGTVPPHLGAKFTVTLPC